MLTSVGFLEMSAPEPFSISVVSITDGMSFQLAVDKTDTLDELRRLIGRHVKVKKEKICLLFRDKEMVGGTLEKNKIVEGSTVKFVPRTETGIISPTAEDAAVIQALESLSERQVKIQITAPNDQLRSCR